MIVVHIFLTASYMLIGRMCLRSGVPDTLGASRMTLSFIHDGVARFSQRLFICSYTTNCVAADQLLTMLAVSPDGPGAASFLIFLKAVWKSVNVTSPFIAC
jgi:hypothetical protein